MASELGPGTLGNLLGSVGADAVARGGKVITQLALTVEALAKANARNGSHKYGTPTPATPGKGPAVISGTLRRTITHTRAVQSGLGWSIQVGMAGGIYPPYGDRKTTSSKYAYYLENYKLPGGIGYPFLQPAARMAYMKLPSIARRSFSGGWLR